ncbi:MAG: alpha/beta hydrolase [Vicinamibacterales bacterium]
MDSPGLRTSDFVVRRAGRNDPPHDRIRLHVVREGTGPPVILLHGFPEFWYSWRNQIAPLAAAGYAVSAPDMRGFNLSDKPQGVEHYAIDHLVADVAALVEATGLPRAHIVGHDWGGLVAWFVAARRPDIVDTLSIINAPHPTIYGRGLWRTRQWFKSFYVPVFMTPWLAEVLISAGGYFLLRQMFTRGAGRRGVFSDQDMARYVEAAARPGALTSGLNYYRANARLGFRAEPLPRIDSPTLVIWGERDPALGVELLNGLDEMVSDLRIERLPGVGHWVQSEAPDAVTALLLSHFAPTRT